MRALIWGAAGTPEVVTGEAPQPEEHQVLVAVQAAEVAVPPGASIGDVLGTQGTGTIVRDPQGLLPEGTLVAWAGVPGSCAEAACVPRDRMVAVPGGIAPEIAATMLGPAMMAHVLLFSLSPVEAGSTVLINPADDPVGLISAQWASSLGARVIAVSPSGEASPHLDHAIVVQRAHVAPRRAAEAGGADIALHGAGKQGLDHSLSSLRPRGTLCLHGNPAQPVKRISPLDLAAQGSLNLACPVLEDYVREPEGFRTRSQAVTQAITEGHITIPHVRVHSPEEAADIPLDELAGGLTAVRF
ncbi:MULTISPECIES: zinc-binding dehydrogenase [unclassified Corynebacterium]|uniref:zinc-binding dehydrogenase n=1 Tax=unclassified Corynebacterium TaxID=2624378 RepID=UPI0029CA03C8|nr:MULTISPECIES: zinc-binding dehydrogenase [unclassified Corynebacterium]WPF65128.1 zinc-binding dehydrogenase [Corynebacterium sp. 22KM0430]WPF67624.1 zinc-binding dehydrogenase [Corynebacterium sp. 21KM1197]